MNQLGIAPDQLTQTRAAFEAWRANRRGRQRIPESLWNAAASLLNTYSLSVVARELRLNPKDLRQRQRGTANPGRRPRFVELTGVALASGQTTVSNGPKGPGSEIRLNLERGDGSRLSVTLSSAEWERVEQLWTAFVRG